MTRHPQRLLGNFIRITLATTLFASSTILPTFAQTQNDDLVDAIAKEDSASLQDAQNSLEFTQFSSCMSMDSVLSKFLEQFEDDDRYGPRYYGLEEDMAIMAQPEATMDLAKSSTPVSDSVMNNGVAGSSSSDYSSTNLQKTNVDEPEIIKTNGDEIVYYNRQEEKVLIIKSPLDRKSSIIDLDSAQVLTEIKLPSQLYNAQLFVSGERLVILASRYVSIARNDSVLDRGNRTSVAIYDISNPSAVSLLKFTDLDGRYTNSRMIDNKLYVLSQLDINRRNLKNSNKKFDRDLLPRALDIDVANRALSVVIPECESVSYLLPSQETIQNNNLYPVFTIVSVIDIADVKKETSSNVVLANAGEIHMTTDSLYIAQNLWFAQTWACPFGGRCIWPSWNDGEHSLIHKFAVEDFSLDYTASNMVPGGLLTQYSMDEDSDGNFRILTRKNRSDGTNFYTFDPGMAIKGSLSAIQPGEQFKASRYIDDKLYLVTFEQTDPLFVIDVANISAPKVIGELMIPGFSTYLHPMGDNADGIQHLIGLGYGANEDGRQQGLQLSLYEINYNAPETPESRCGRLKDTTFVDQYKNCLETASDKNILVKQIDSKTLGGIGSQSEAMQNPRMFVVDKNNTVTLPMVLQDEESAGENCNVYKAPNGTVMTTNCYPITKQVTSFAGLKSFDFDVNSGISETFSADYFDLFDKLYGHSEKDGEYYYSNIDYRSIQDAMMRVGFAGDALYMINNDFASFMLPGQDGSRNIYFDAKLQQK